MRFPPFTHARLRACFIASPSPSSTAEVRHA